MYYATKTSNLLRCCAAVFAFLSGCGSQTRHDVVTPRVSSRETNVAVAVPSSKVLPVLVSAPAKLPLAKTQVSKTYDATLDACLVDKLGVARCSGSRNQQSLEVGRDLAAFAATTGDRFCSVRTNRDVIWQALEEGKLGPEYVIGRVRGDRFSLIGDDNGGCYWSDQSGTYHHRPKIGTSSWSDELTGLVKSDAYVCGLYNANQLKCLNRSSELVSVSGTYLGHGLALTEHVLCDWDAVGSVRCVGGGQNWGFGNGFSNTIMWHSWRGISTLVHGKFYSCAQNHQNQVWCWGSGPVALAIGAFESFPAKVPIERITEMDAGLNQVCFRTENGEKTCIGDPAHEATLQERVSCSSRREDCTLKAGILSCPTTLYEAAFTLKDVAFGTTDRSFGCAKMRNEDVSCWSMNAYPVNIPQLRGAKWLRETRCGEICGMVGQEELVCIVSSFEGPINEAFVPIVIENLPPVTKVVGASNHLCAETAKGEVYCWGFNDSNSICKGKVQALKKPEHILTLKPGERFLLDDNLSCIESDGKFKCWGWCRHLNAAGLGIECIPAPDCSEAKSKVLWP